MAEVTMTLEEYHNLFKGLNTLIEKLSVFLYFLTKSYLLALYLLSVIRVTWFG